MAHTHRALSVCPVCGEGLSVTRLGCSACGTELVGSFARCPFCALDDADLDLLRVFLVSRGNLKEVEKHLGVSYPTARSRFNAVLDRLGLLGDAEPEPTEPADEESAPTEAAPPQRDDPAPDGPGGDEVRDQVLAQVAAGVLSPSLAAELLGRLR